MFIARTLRFILFVSTVTRFLFITGTTPSCGVFSVHDVAIQSCVDFEWCLYKFYSQTVTWFDAKAICEKENMTLAHITTASQYTYLSNLMKSTLTTLFANPPSSVWVGAYRDYDGEARWHDGCSGVDTSFLGDDSNGVCFILADGSRLDAGSCSTKLPFLCQTSILDVDRCFTPTLEISDAVKGYSVSSIRTPSDCYPRCALDCIGFIYSSPSCTLVSSGSSLWTKGHLYMKDLLRTEIPSDVTVSLSNLENICPSPVTTPNHLTSSSTPSTTASITPTKTVTKTSSSPTTTAFETPTCTMAASTLTSSLMGPSDFESSIPEPLTVAKLPPESTPPLTSVFTSVNLETTSLPTETETLSMSCSNCPCIKSTKIYQEELEESISQLKEQLRVNPKSLSSFKRKLTSAPDDRQSAANIGYVAALILCLIPGFFILMDMGRLTREFKQFISRLRNPCRAEATDHSST